MEREAPKMFDAAAKAIVDELATLRIRVTGRTQGSGATAARRLTVSLLEARTVGAGELISTSRLAAVLGSIVVSPRGEVLAEGDDTPRVLTATLDLADLRSWRETFPALRDVRPGLLGSVPVERGEPAPRPDR